MEFFHRAKGNPSRLAVFPGAFNPITVAHLALVRAAFSHADEVVLVLPRLLPHKVYTRASFEARTAMLCAVSGRNEPISVATSDGGLFVDIAAECRAAYHPAIELSFLCGRDAAERICKWDYGRPDALPEMLREFNLLVAERQGGFEPPAELREAVRRMEVPGEFSEISSTEVRRRIQHGESWEHLVPLEIHDTVRKIYR